MKKAQKLLSMILLLAMLLTLAPAAALAEEPEEEPAPAGDEILEVPEDGEGSDGPSGAPAPTEETEGPCEDEEPVREGAVDDWYELLDAVENAPNGATITLAADCVATYTIGNPVVIAQGQSITIDLNGYTIDRGLRYGPDISGDCVGFVIANNGDLTIIDSSVDGSGRITGGKEANDGGGIYNTGTLTLAGGTIAYNQAGASGGGVYNAGGATFTMTGGAITNNTAVDYHGGGVYNAGTMNLEGGRILYNTAWNGQGAGILNNGTLNVCGAPDVSDNNPPNGQNIYLRAAHPTMTVTGPLTEGANLWVTKAGGSGPITSGYSSYNNDYPGEFFGADDYENYGVALSGGEACIATPWHISVAESEHGSVTLDLEGNEAYAGQDVPMTVTPEEGYWPSTIGLYGTDQQLIGYVNPQAPSFRMPDRDTVVAAEFSAVKAVSTDVLYPFAGLTLHAHGTLTADKELAAGGETVTLTLTTDEGYGLKAGGMTVCKVLGAEKTQIPVTEQADGSWTFIMPDGDYTVEASAEIEWKKAPPAGTKMPYFYIDGTMTGGTVSAGSVPVLTPPLSPSNLYTPSVTQITMTATPSEGYVLKGWEVVTVNSSGEPFLGYSLPAEREGNNYILSFDKVNNNYIFRIRAIFAQEQQACTLNLEYYDESGAVHTGSSLSVDSAGPWYAGDTVTVHVSLVPGAMFSTYTDYDSQEIRSYPKITYDSTEENIYGGHTKYIEPSFPDGDSFTFVVPGDIDPNRTTIDILAMFKDTPGKAVTVAYPNDEKIGVVETDKTEAALDETVTVTVTVTKSAHFDPDTGLSVNYTDGAGQPQTAPVTLTNTRDGGDRTFYTYTFVMPDYAVSLDAAITPKDYTITLTHVPEGHISGFDAELSVNGMLITDHVASVADAGDTVELTAWVESPAHARLAIRRVYYVIEGSQEQVELELSYNSMMNPSCSFPMPAGNVTVCLELEIAYELTIDGSFGEFSTDQYWHFPGDVVTVTGVPDNSVYAHDRMVLTAAFQGQDLAFAPVEGEGYAQQFVMPEGPLTVHAEFQMEPVTYTIYSYSEEEGLTSTEETLVRYLTLTADVTELTASCYVVNQDLIVEHRLDVKENSTLDLIILEGVTLTAKKGIIVPESGCLNLYGAGSLIARSDESFDAPIGGEEDKKNGTITFHGPTVDAVGKDGSPGIGGGGDAGTSTKSITIYAGTITARGGNDAAGIGGGYDCAGCPIYIHGGTVDATGGNNGAGIGGGSTGGANGIYITGGTVTAVGGEWAAGIGGGINGGKIRDITISGGTVTATGGYYGAGIGSGAKKDTSGTITICGDDVHVTATGGTAGAGIGGGGDSGNLFTGDSMSAKIVIDCGGSSYIKATGGGHGSGIGAGESGNLTGSVEIRGGVVDVYPGDIAAGIGGGAEIGFSAGGEGGKVTISGNSVVSIYGLEYGEAIGSDCNDSKSGSLTLDDDLCVLVGGVPVAAKDRVKRAHSSNDGKTLVVKPCEHPQCKVTAMADGHIFSCSACYHSFTKEPHQLAGEPATCTVCGYHSSMLAVHFAPGEGASGEMETVYVEPDAEFELPESAFTPPAGKRFAGWMLSGDGLVYQEGDTVTISAHSTLTAQWENEYTVTFLPGLNEGEFEGEMDAEAFGEGETFFVPENHFRPLDESLGFVRWAFEGADGSAGYLYADEEVPMSTDLVLTAQYDVMISVTFLPGYDEAAEEPIVAQAARGSVRILPECPFTLPADKDFVGWSVVIGENEALTLAPGETITVTAETTVTALWRQLGPWEALQRQIDAAEDGVETTITLTEDVTAADTDTALQIPAGKIITLNLDGHTLDRGLSADNMKEEGNVISVCSGAVLLMTGGSTGGTVTGGGNNGSGGGICVDAGAVLELTNIAVCGNTCTDHGGGIYLAADAQCSAVNSSIDGNRTTVGENGSGGGVYFAGGTLHLTGCSVSDNRSRNLGGGLYIGAGSALLTGCEIDRNDAYANACGGGVFLSGGTLRLEDCEITGNTSSKNNPHGIGVFVNVGTEFIVSGDTRITDNKFGSSQLNVFLHNGAAIMPSSLADTAVIGVAVGRTNASYIAEYKTGIITHGLPGNGSAANFTSDLGAYAVTLNGGGEAILERAVTVSFASGDSSATGTMDSVSFARGTEYALPACGFEVPGKVFVGWLVGGQTMQPGETITVGANITVTALWRMPGDINGDGVVNNKDLTRLQRWLKYHDVDVVEENLDVNGDGSVSNKDLTRLQRYIKYGNVEIH